jgi:RNA polymerase sigma-70 factor (ECF subfamily)
MARANAFSLPVGFRALLTDLERAESASDQAWVIALMRKTGPVVASMLWRMLGSESDALDAYQTAICRMLAKGKSEIGRNRAGYFYRTALNAAIEIVRQRERDKRSWPKLVAAEAGRDADRSEHLAVSTRLDQQQMREQMRNTIMKLPPHLRDVIALREMAGLSYREVASVLGIRSGTARLYRHQAVIRLTSLMQASQDAAEVNGRSRRSDEDVS